MTDSQSQVPSPNLFFPPAPSLRASGSRARRRTRHVWRARETSLSARRSPRASAAPRLASRTPLGWLMAAFTSKRHTPCTPSWGGREGSAAWLRRRVWAASREASPRPAQCIPRQGVGDQAGDVRRQRRIDGRRGAPARAGPSGSGAPRGIAGG